MHRCVTKNEELAQRKYGGGTGSDCRGAKIRPVTRGII